jgi:hypothetical protein
VLPAVLPSAEQHLVGNRNTIIPYTHTPQLC